MKKYIKILAALSALVLCMAAFSACSKLSAYALSAAGSYKLTRIDGTDKVSADDYDYNTITLSTNGEFTMENESQGEKYSASGKWNLEGETLTLKLSGLFSKKEKHTLTEDKIYLSGTLGGEAVTLEYTKQ